MTDPQWGKATDSGQGEQDAPPLVTLVFRLGDGEKMCMAGVAMDSGDFHADPAKGWVQLFEGVLRLARDEGMFQHEDDWIITVGKRVRDDGDG